MTKKKMSKQQSANTDNLRRVVNTIANEAERQVAIMGTWVNMIKAKGSHSTELEDCLYRAMLDEMTHVSQTATNAIRLANKAEEGATDD